MYCGARFYQRVEPHIPSDEHCIEQLIHDRLICIFTLFFTHFLPRYPPLCMAAPCNLTEEEYRAACLVPCHVFFYQLMKHEQYIFTHLSIPPHLLLLPCFLALRTLSVFRADGKMVCVWRQPSCGCFAFCGFLFSLFWGREPDGCTHQPFARCMFVCCSNLLDKCDLHRAGMLPHSAADLLAASLAVV